MSPAARLLAALLTFALAATASAGEKALIEFGWDEPDTAFLRRHVATIASRDRAGPQTSRQATSATRRFDRGFGSPVAARRTLAR